MKQDWTHLEKIRIRRGEYASQTGDLFGAFFIKNLVGQGHILCIASSGDADNMPWEHVSCTVQHAPGKTSTPRWEHMAYIKKLFWGDDECVVQFHPPKTEYVNIHPNCLHLWKPFGKNLETPPTIAV